MASLLSNCEDFPLNNFFSPQEFPNQASNWSATLLEWLGIPNILLEHVPDTPPEYYSCHFKASKLRWYGIAALVSPAGQPPVGPASMRTRMGV